MTYRKMTDAQALWSVENARYGRFVTWGESWDQIKKKLADLERRHLIFYRYIDGMKSFALLTVLGKQVLEQAEREYLDTGLLPWERKTCDSSQ